VSLHTIRKNGTGGRLHWVRPRINIPVAAFPRETWDPTFVNPESFLVVNQLMCVIGRWL